MEKENKVFLWSKYFFIIALSNVFVASVQQLYNSTTSLFVDSLGGTATYTGLALTLFTMAATVMRIVAGQLLDKKGRLFTIILGLAIYGSASFAFELHILNLIAPLRLVQGIGYSLCTTGIAVAITDVIPKPRMGEGIGYYGLGGSLATALGPSLALTLCDNGNGDFSPVFFTATGFVVLVMIAYLVIRYEKDDAFMARKLAAEATVVTTVADVEEAAAAPSAEELPVYRGLWKYFEKTAIKPSIISAFIYISQAAISSFLTLYAKDVNFDKIGLYYTFNAIAMVLVRLLFSKVSDKRGPLVSMLPACVIGVIGYSCLIFAGDINWLFYVAGALIGICFGIAQPALNATVIKRADNQRRGVASSTFMMSFDIGIGLGGLLWGMLIDVSSYRIVFAGCSISIAVSLILSCLWLREKKGSAAA